MPSTPRGGFRYPAGTDNSNNVRLDVQRLAEDVAAKAALYSQTVAASRPAPGVIGRMHYATDTGLHAWDTGTSWIALPSLAGGSTIVPSGPGVTGLAIRATAGQTANLLNVMAPDGSSHVRIGPNGGLALFGSNVVTFTGQVPGGGFGDLFTVLEVLIDGVSKRLPIYNEP